MTPAQDLAALVAALRTQRQIDMDGCEVAVSRQACDEAADTITALSERVRVLEEALRFYADISKYPAPLTGGAGELYFDCGKVARAALTSGGRG